MEERGRRKVRVGMVVSTKMQKSCVVEIERLVKHPVYKKTLRRRKRLMVHDEEGKCQVGDVVRIMETRPMSARKRWRYVETVREAPAAFRGEEQ
jgi:small subunit ribosomal protein S17